MPQVASCQVPWPVLVVVALWGDTGGGSQIAPILERGSNNGLNVNVILRDFPLIVHCFWLVIIMTPLGIPQNVPNTEDEF